jgi:putative hemolysin
MINNATALRSTPEVAAQRLRVSIARTPDEVRDAQRLRHRVFVEEMGAPAAAGGRLERDRFDPFCKHLIVRDRLSGDVVGTYRILTPERAAALGSFMAEREFDLARLAPIRGEIAEVGRACIDAPYRCGAIIMLLWSGLASYAMERGFGYLFGCVSVGLGEASDGYAIYERLAPRHLAPPEYRVLPRTELARRGPGSNTPPPPLLKGYLRAGAWICGEPAWDPEFGTVDLPVLLPLGRIERRYARHFVRVRAL